ncbi:MAG: hypothetical protein RL346_631 [Verrucomicrobiota bacterium]|jgi:large conductance mechanosensitive channel
MFQEFKEFILKGNAISLAVGVIIGAAFSKVVSAFSTGIIEPLLQSIGGNPEIALKIWIFDIGLVISAVISLMITGAVLFFIFIRPMNKLMAKVSPAKPSVSAEAKLLTEIRDLLAKKS